jgi:hypothetical protein
MRKDHRGPAVSSRFCPFCGQPIVAGGTFCPSCGAAVSATGAAAGSAGASAPPPPGWGGTPIQGAVPFAPSFAMRPGTPASASRPADLHALSNVTIAAVLALIGGVLSLVVLFGTNVASFLAVSTAGSGGTTLSLDLTALYLFAITAGVGVVLSIIELVLYRQAFHTLAPHDTRFSTPSTLVLLAIIGIIIVVLGAAYLLYALYQAVLCAGAGNPLTGTCLSTASLLEAVGLIGVAAILAFVGWIGLLIGIWRLGSRYEEGLFKVGAVLLIFPVLNLVAAILILVAARSAREKLAAGSATPSFG